ncbi:HD-GYP domain-containing protein [Clostridium sp.]|uniref:HD-GYP domain-containing protein n=1 Tax=Clostridium sp. TaxID=1506 RepID=UPI0026277C5B|nr:HD-GYP domain-containing protein [Clostridium sp.]
MNLKRKLVNISDLEVGMVISNEIVHNDSVLIGKNIILTESMLNKLNNSYIYEKVSIYVPEDENIKEIESLKAIDKAFNTISKDMENIFLNNSNLNLEKINEISEFSKKLENVVKSNTSILKNIILKGSEEDPIYKHSVNVAALSYLIGQWCDYNSKDLNKLIFASMLHDFGKSKIDQNILNKKTPLTREEFKVIKTHPTLSYNEIKNIPYISKDVLYAVIMHHERCDGSGYPLGLKGSQISDFAKILSIADVFDAINSNRIYKEKRKPFEALKLIKEESINGRLDFFICNKFLNGLSNFYIGQDVLLSNQMKCKIIQMNTNEIDKPLLLNNTDFIDLSKEKDLLILEIL